MEEVMLATKTVALLMTDVVGSTRLEQRYGPQFLDWLQHHVDLAVELAAAHGGEVLKHRGEGDSLFAAFADPASAIRCAIAWQLAFREIESFGPPVAVRMAIDFGEAYALESDFWGGLVNRCARLREVSHGGQILVSGHAAESAKFDFIDLGNHTLRDVEQPLMIYQVIAPGLERDFPPLRNPLHLAQLPSYASSFTGRDQERTELRRLLSQHRLISILGPGGSGKTRLAVEVASRSGSQFKDGILHVDLVSADSAESLIQSLANRLDATANATSIDQLASRLNNLATLVVLDNADHAIEATREVLTRLMVATHKPQFLVTSREALGFPEEHRFTLGSLGTDATLMLMERAAACGARIGPGDQPIYRQLAAAVDELPLGIELLAPMLAVMQPAEALRLMREFSALELEAASGSSRHRSLDGMIAWSVDRLDSEDRDRLQSLGLFVGSFPLDSAAAVWGSTGWGAAQNMRRLVEKSLVQFEPHSGASGRYRLLQTMAAYTRKAPCPPEVARRFVEHIASVTAELDRDLRKAQTAEHFQSWDLWNPSVRKAVGLASEANAVDAGMRIIHHASLFWGYRAGEREDALLAKKLLSSLPSEPSKTRAEFLNSLAVLCVRAGQREEAEVHATASLADARAIGDAAHEAKSLLNLSIIALQSGRREEAIALSREAEPILRQGNDLNSLAACLSNLGAMLNELETLDESIGAIQEAIALFDRLGNRGRLVLALQNLAEALMKADRPAEALPPILRSAEIAAELNLAGSLAQAAQLGAVCLEKMGLGKEALKVWNAADRYVDGETILRHATIQNAFPSEVSELLRSTEGSGNSEDWQALLRGAIST